MKVYIVLSCNSGISDVEIVTVDRKSAERCEREIVIDRGDIWTASEVNEGWGEKYLGTDSSEFIYAKKQTDDGDDVYYAKVTEDFDIKMLECEVEGF